MDYTFTVDEPSAQLLLNALAELPFKVSADLISNLVNQIGQQKKMSQDETPHSV